jgi:hypothetical protein
MSPAASEEHKFYALHVYMHVYSTSRPEDPRKYLNHSYMYTCSSRPFTKDDCRMTKHVIACFWTSNQSACLMTAPPLIYSDNTDTKHSP